MDIWDFCLFKFVLALAKVDQPDYCGYVQIDMTVHIVIL